MVIAAYKANWQYLSKDHEKIAKELSKIIADYLNGELEHFAYAVIGTFGAGKTQLLYHIHKNAIENGMLPWYVTAEDLFREVIHKDTEVFTPGSLFTFVEEKVKNLKTSLCTKNDSEARRILDPREKLRTDAPEIVDSIIRNFSGSDISNLKVVLLVDELEGQYGILQRKVQTEDRSPLREWLEAKNYLKFVVFAPAGIYELGGADRDRVKRFVLPPADIDYVRKKHIEDPGRSNACWWLSRGKARQLFKTCEILKEKDINLGAAQASKIIKSELDQIGQAPTQVPPAVTSAMVPSKIPFLLNLCPITGEKAKRHVIDTIKLDTGALADKLIEAFNVNADNAILISEYFKRTVKTLSDSEGRTYIENGGLPELFCLVFDHLLEYEHGSPEVSTTIGEILNLYERVMREGPSLYRLVATLWELKETEYQLPLTMEQIRNSFPFPSMNPIVKTHSPIEMRKKWEGKGLPVWTWSEGNVSVLFFASERDFEEFSKKDTFVDDVLPDGKGTLCTSPTGSKLKADDPFLKWLHQNKKLNFVDLPPLLSDFLLSASGEIQRELPGDLQLHLKNFKENKGDVLLSRKAEIYDEAINEIIRNSLPTPETFDKGQLPDTESVWGKGQMDRDVAINGIALAFTELTTQERQVLADIRDLFRSSKEGRGSGDLTPLMPRMGYIALCDDLFPRYGRKRELKDSEPVGRLKTYWRDDERDSLVELAHILPCAHFLKLHPDEDMNRLLEALWKTVRGDFDFKYMDARIQTFERDIYSTLEDCCKLERELIDLLAISGINFGDTEQLIKAKEGVKKLSDIAKEVIKDSGSGGPLIKCIVNIFMGVLSERIAKNIRTLASSSGNVRRGISDLKNTSKNIKENYWEYRKAINFVGITEETIVEIVSKQMGMGGTPTLQELELNAKERKDYLDEISRNLSLLDTKLGELGDIFSKMTVGA